MCGIAGLIHKGKSSNVGGEMTAMLQALKHRGPDSTGYAVYGKPTEGDYIMRLKVAEAEDMHKGRGIHQVIVDRIAAVEEILAEHGAAVPVGARGARLLRTYSPREKAKAAAWLLSL